MTINLIEPQIIEQKIPTVWQRSSRFITCLFCGLRGRQAGQSPLCSNCLIDPVQTRIAIHYQLDNWLAQQVKAMEEWETFRDAHAERWQQIEASRTLPDFAQRCDAHRAKDNIYGKLLDAERAYETALSRLGAERDRLSRALEALS